MRNQIVVDHRDQKVASLASLGLGLAASISGLFMTVTNPQITSINRDAAIYANGSLAQNIDVGEDNTLRNVGLGVGLLGLASMAFSLRLNPHVVMDEIKEIEQVIDKVDTQVKAIGESFDNLSRDQKDHIMRPLVELIHEHDWLIYCINHWSIVIVGSTGTGKSRLAMSIALMKALLERSQIVIGDLDGTANISQKTWVAGTLYGAYQPAKDTDMDIYEGKEREVLKAISIARDPNRSADSQKIICIFDEISKWSDANTYRELPNQITAIIDGGAQEARKRNMTYIYLVHGLEAGQWFGGNDAPSGKLNGLLSSSVVIYLRPPEQKAELNIGAKRVSTKSEILFFKQAGTALKSSDTPPTESKDTRTWKKYNIPINFDPDPLAKKFGGLIKSFGIQLKTTGILATGKSKSEEKTKEVLKEL